MIRYLSTRFDDILFRATRIDDFRQALQRADVVVDAVPGGVGIRYLIDADALEAGSIAVTGLDVCEYQPKVPPP